MSRQNRKSQKNHQPATTVAPGSNNDNASSSNAGKLKHWFQWALGVGLLTTVINIGLAWFSYQQVRVARENVVVADKQLSVAKETLDRSTGKVPARFEIADFRPHVEQYREDQMMMLQRQKGRVVPYYKDANSMVLLPPTIHLNNTGEDAIDAIRIEVCFIEGVVDRHIDLSKSVDAPADWYKNETPVSLRKVELLEPTLPRQWKPGESLSVPVLKGVMGQLREVQSRTGIDILHTASLEMIVSARLAGSNVFDSDGTRMRYVLNWIPRGFGDDEFKRVYDAYQPRVEFGPPVPPTIKFKKGVLDDTLLFKDSVNYSNPKSYEPKK